MDAVVVGPVERVPGADVVVTSAEIRVVDDAYRVSFETPAEVPLSKHNLGDIYAAVGLLIAMRKGLPIKIADAVSPSLLDNLRNYAQIYATWFPDDMTEVDIDAPVGRDRAPRRAARGVTGQCFTGGVDSLYSLLTAERTPDILINGLGVDTTDPRRVAAADPTARLKRVAARHGSELILVRANVRRIMLEAGVAWGTMAHGAALAAMGHLLSSRLSTLIVPATHSYTTAQPWGSSPWTDPLLGSTSLTVVHHGATETRVGKTEAIAHAPDVRDGLRVCLKVTSDENCGECKKCVRTMLGLEMFGALDSSNRLPRQIDPAVVDSITLTSTQDLRHIVDIRDRAVELGTRDDIVAMTESMIERSRRAMPERRRA